MKRVYTLIVAFVLAVAMTACANTAMNPGQNGAAGDSFRGNVSTTDDGRVNGTNRRAGQTDGGAGRSDSTNRTGNSGSTAGSGGAGAANNAGNAGGTNRTTGTGRGTVNAGTRG